MKLRVRWTLFFLLGLGAIAPLQTRASDQIIEVEGSVTIRRENDSQHRSASVGTTINRGDLIRPARGSKVRVGCNDGSIWLVPSGQESGLGSGCPASVATSRGRIRGGDDFLAFLNQTFVPATQILDLQPILRWQAVSGAAQYQVQVREGDRILWQTTTRETSSPYQGEPLQVDKNYQLVITAINLQTAPQSSSLLFRAIAPPAAADLKAKTDRIQALDLSDEAKAIAIAALYQAAAQPNTDPPASRGLLLEALPLLEAIVAADNPTPYVHRLLGDLYLQLGWIDLAQLRYQSAIDLARLAGNRQDWADAQVGLASVAAARQAVDQARSALQNARIGYLLLGDAEQVAQIDQWLEKLAL
jgi:hypothetical protein